MTSAKIIARRLLENEDPDLEVARYINLLADSPRKKVTTCCDARYTVSKSRSGTRVICHKCGHDTRLKPTIIEAEDDFDSPQSNLPHYLHSKYPGIEIDSVGLHWAVYRIIGDRRDLLGELYYDDTLPDDLKPENRAYWDKHRWTVICFGNQNDDGAFVSFDTGLQHILKVRKIIEAFNPDDPQGTFNRYLDPVAITVKNHEGREFYVELSIDQVGDRDKSLRYVPSKLRKNAKGEKMHPVVIFHDVSMKSTAGGLKGQQCSSYYASDLVQHKGGLPLYGGIPEWYVDADSMARIVAWIKDELEVKRDFRLIKVSSNKPHRSSWGTPNLDIDDYVYESFDPDSPDQYIHPDHFTGQPRHEKLASGLRIALRPYYDEIKIDFKPTELSSLAAFEGWENWTVQCKRNSRPLQLPAYGTALFKKIPWRDHVETWFYTLASENGFYLYDFTFVGRLRKDPTFQFATSPRPTSHERNITA